ncbi:MAG: tetratricopeptide repeat protein [Gemmatimonadetes bacterium]|nr:tetratricopeptide repeat protein [Gemmatimonadota bacterium]
MIRRPLALAGLLLAVACGPGGAGDRAADDPTARLALPAPSTVDPGPAVEVADFLGAESCAGCHEEQYRTWQASTHGRAGGRPSEDVVIAPFDGRPIEFADARVLPERGPDGYAFRVRREGRADQVLPVSGVVGGGHMVGGGTQGFLAALPDGTVRFLPFDWSRDEAAWFCNTGTRADRGWARIDRSLRLADCGDWPPLRVFGHTDRFANCQECHGSQVTVAWDAAERRFASSHTDLRINCESCHGPGRAHVEAVRGSGGDADPAIRSLATLDTDASLRVCFQCHALKDVVEPGYLPGRSLEEHYALKFPILGDRPYFPDGRVRTFAYQGNHLYSACYAGGSMTCTDCHAPHSNAYVDVWREPLPDRFDDGQCLACHASRAADPAAHTRHAEGSEGSRCVACHMPYLQHPELGEDIRFSRSDHVISIPRPAFDDSLGLRSACVQCHEDRSPAELQAITERWWGPLKPHHPLVAGLLRARQVNDRVEAARLLLRPDLEHPIAQFAGLAHLLERHLRPDMAGLEPEIIERLTALSGAVDLDVRALALATLHYAAGEEPEIRDVLVGALEGASGIGLRKRWGLALGYMADRDRDAGRVPAALATYRKALELAPDDPRILAAMALALRRAGRAEDAVTMLRRALEIQPHLPLARVNLGVALQEAGRPADGAAMLREAIEREPFEPLGYFSMGNLLLRAGSPDQAEEYYARAVELDPSLDRGWFYLARARIEQGEYHDALPAARSALEFAPDDEGVRQMVADLERVTAAAGPRPR